MKLLAAVTGAAGFIGSHLVEELVLSGNTRVRAIVRSNSNNQLGNLLHLPKHILDEIEIVYADILDQEDLKKAFRGADRVYHLAAQISVPYSMHAPSLFIKFNIGGTYNVLQAALDSGVAKTVVISSSEVYGGTMNDSITESQILCAKSPYAASKIGAEKIAESFYHTFNLDVAILRPFNTYGPRQSERAVIPRIINQALDSDVIRLGNIRPTRDFVFVKDTVAGMIKAGESDTKGGTFNLATGQDISIEDLVHLIGKTMGKSLEIETDSSVERSSTGEVWQLKGNAELAREVMGWSPLTELEQGLAQVIDFLKQKKH